MTTKTKTKKITTKAKTNKTIKVTTGLRVRHDGSRGIKVQRPTTGSGRESGVTMKRFTPAQMIALWSAIAYATTAKTFLPSLAGKAHHADYMPARVDTHGALCVQVGPKEWVSPGVLLADITFNAGKDVDNHADDADQYDEDSTSADDHN